jgi:hypothetical protein
MMRARTQVDSQLLALLEQTISDNKGILFAKPAFVYRNTYTGRGIIADNQGDTSTCRDSRGYLPVERWILSITKAENPVQVRSEGITELVLSNKTTIPLDEAVDGAGLLLFGSFRNSWPLIKLLDIGGKEVVPDFTSSKETPPIPAHVHGGYVIDGSVRGPGKLEAYFFPPTEVRPYNLRTPNVHTRIGLKPATSISEFLAAVRQFGLSDRMYDILNEFPVEPYDTWLVPPGIVHAPGPWITLEVQTPQDDYNLLSWQLGKRLHGTELEQEFKSSVLRGLQSPEELLSLVNWQLSTSANLKMDLYRKAQMLEKGQWGLLYQIFFENFLGFSIEIDPEQSYVLGKDDRPRAAIVWSGAGRVNDKPILAESLEYQEFLVTPGFDVMIENSGREKLILFVISPIVTTLTAKCNDAVAYSS